jgi:hypothetical protein
MLPVRFFYRKESGELWPDNHGDGTETRNLAFAYTYNQDTGTVQYGASVHRGIDPAHEPFQRGPHRQTAMGRLVRRPVTLRVAPNTRFSDVEEEIRDAMQDGAGVRGRRLDVPLQVETVEKWAEDSEGNPCLTGVHHFIVG